MNDKTILVNLRNVYGNTLAYPGCEEAKTFAHLAGTKTLTRHSLNLIEKLGYGVLIRSYGGASLEEVM